MILVLLALLIGVAGVVLFRRDAPTGHAKRDPSRLDIQELTARVAALETQEEEVDRTIWFAELQAQHCGAVFERLWDSLNAASDKIEVLRAFPVREWYLPQFGPPQQVEPDIELYQSSGPARSMAGPDWSGLLNQIATEGWTALQFELRHIRFETNQFGQPRHSTFHARVDLVNSNQLRRAAIEGDLRVQWALGASSEDPPTVDRIDAQALHLLLRQGIPPFQQVLFEEVRPLENSHFIDPLILYDLDGDGLSEIILAAKNLVFKRQADGHYAPQQLCQHPPGLLFTGLIADFDGDGVADFLGAVFHGLLLYKGSPAGTFDEPGQLVWTAQPHLKYAQALTCGDIDHDGDLDLWLGQYKNPYERGQMPTPYYDANDGHPSYLLLNDGRGHFTDATEARGLGQKRWRRSYSASWVDLNADGHLDLLVVSDFAGVDVYANNGQGRFSDRTASWLPERHLFGMAHTFADFNRDGRLDFLVMGMHCPTAQRLNQLGLRRPDRPDYETMRLCMNQGNRLFLGQPEGRFQASTLGASISRSGWSWGCGAFDFDNDGYPDVYIANGHETRQSVKDYESEYWLHDIYVGNSQENLITSAYFGAKIGRTRGHGQSYGGYEKNRLFLNQRGLSFLEAGHVLGVALEADSRNCATDDLDGDGRVDLLLTTFEAWPKVRQTLRILQNTLDRHGHWIGFRLRDEHGGLSPIGTSITLRYEDKTVSRLILTGDSHRVQHAPTVHFGLGACTNVAHATIQWANGRQFHLDHPGIDRYHTIQSVR